MNEQPMYTNQRPGPDDRPLSGMAVTSLVLGIVFLCLGPLAIVPLVLGIIAITTTGRDGAKRGQGLAIAGTSLGGVGILGTCLSAGLFLPIFLPAFATAKNRANQFHSQASIREILTGLEGYALANNGAYPAQNGWEGQLIDGGFVFEESLTSRVGDVDGDGVIYIYLPEGYASTASQLVVYEDPEHYEDWVVVGYADGSTDSISLSELNLILAEQIPEQSSEQDESP
tara:strand:+ start:63980 stop:64663 length:684 start_codon:yes stop_codon:yes gene_type:complete